MPRRHHPLVRAYLNHLTLAGYRPSSIQAKALCLAAWRDYLDKENSDVQSATRLEVEAFLSRPHLAVASRRAYRSHLRGLYRWAVDDGHAHVDPTAKVPPIRVPANAPRPLGQDDLRVALDAAPPRMRAWLLLMSLAGLRCLEVAGLRPADLRVEDGAALLFLRETKGGASAWQPAHPEVVAALAALPVSGGRWWDVTPKTVSQLTNRHLAACGVDGTAHQLRHSFATAVFAGSGHDLLTTAQLLRHANASTAQVYAQLDPRRPAEVVRGLRAV